MRHLPLLVVAVAAVASCGSEAKFYGQRTSHGRESPVPSVPEKAPDPTPPQQADAHPAPKPDEPGFVTDAAVSRKVYDDYMSHMAPIAYYQADSRLQDIFSQSKDSQLCWPAALAYDMEYQRRFKTPALAALPLPSVGDDAARLAGDVRYFTIACSTSLEVGTTVPQGVACIDAHYKASGYVPHVTVTGLDTKWDSLGMYPVGTTIRPRALHPDDLKADVHADQSIILLIGFYQLDATQRTWNRVRGHFLSVTGYGFKTPWGADELTIDVVNPGIDYSARAPDQRHDQLNMRRLDLTSLPVALPYAVNDVDYRIDGAGFTEAAQPSQMALVESAISFNASWPEVAN